MMPLRPLLLAAVLLLAACGGGDGPTTSTPPEVTPPPVVPPPVTPPPVTPPPTDPPPIIEARALWVNRFEWSTAAGIAAIMDSAAKARFNVVYFQVRGAGDALYRSNLEPCAISLCGRLGGTPSWDPLEVAVQAAQARGLQLHAWVNAFAGWGSGSATTCNLLVESAAGNPRHMLLAHPDWAVVRAGGAAQGCPNAEEYTYVSPGIPEARTHLARVAADIARRYAVDGIHLDRIRYPGPAWSHDGASLASFGRDPASAPAAWADHRRAQVSLAVREVHDSMRLARPAAVLSAAVWQIYADKWSWRSSQGVHDYLQDPAAWTDGGYLDVAVPMTYYAIASTYCAFTDWACLLDDHLARLQPAGGRHVYIGIGATRGYAEVARQVELARARGARGVSVYSYGSAASGGLFTSLADGVFRARATVPVMSWR